MTMRSGPITLELIEEENLHEVVGMFSAFPDRDTMLQQIEERYRPRFDSDGRRNLWGFYSLLGGELAGLSLLGVSSWADLRGYTWADTLMHMRGRGVAPDSKPALFYLGFHLLGLNRIETGCFASNPSSRRSIEKTPGFVFEGTMREHTRNSHGELEDELRYAILKRDWQRIWSDEAGLTDGSARPMVNRI